MKYTPIIIEGYWKDSKEPFKYEAAVGQYDGSFDDEHIFYWFDDFDKVIGRHEDFVIERYTINVTEDTIKQLGFFFDEDLNDIDDKLSSFNEYLKKEENNVFTKNSFLDFIIDYTDWNICDQCNRIANTNHLRWLEYQEGNNKILADKILSKINALAICQECWDEFLAK